MSHMFICSLLKLRCHRLTACKAVSMKITAGITRQQKQLDPRTSFNSIIRARKTFSGRNLKRQQILHKQRAVNKSTAPDSQYSLLCSLTTAHCGPPKCGSVRMCNRKSLKISVNMPVNMFPDQYSTILKKSQCTLCRNKDCVFIQPISGALNLFPACNPHWVYLASAWDSCTRQSKLWSWARGVGGQRAQLRL